MRYQDARPLIRSGDVLAWSHRGIRSWHDLKIWFVRLFTRSEYSHVGLAWVTDGRVFVIEAVMPLVRVYPLSKLLDHGCFWIPSKAPWKATTEEYAMACVGDVYSQIQAMEAPFEMPPADKLWECAELAASILKMDGIDLGTVYTPSAVVQAALERGYPLQYLETPT